VAERAAHNRLVVGSSPTEPTSESELFKKSQVLPEDPGIREILELLLTRAKGDVRTGADPVIITQQRVCQPFGSFTAEGVVIKLTIPAIATPTRVSHAP
jgi:hypothetical protein